MSRLERLQKLAAAEPNDPFVQYGLGMELMSTEQWAAAIEAFDRVLSLDPKYEGAHLQKGKSEIKLGRRDAARQTLRAGLDAAHAAHDEHAADQLREVLAALG